MAIKLPKDADGMTVPLNTTMMYRDDHSQFRVTDFFYEAKPDKWFARSGSQCIEVSTLHLIIIKEGWKALLDDLKRTRDGRVGGIFPPCYYFNSTDNNQAISCDDLSYDEKCPGANGNCEYDLFNDIIYRIYSLLGDAK